MKERLNTSIQSLSLILVAAGLAWVVWSGDTSMKQMLSYLIILVAFIEMLSLYLVNKIYPESHTSFKMGSIASLFILLGIKSMAPGFFIPLTIGVFAVNFLYNFYTNNKRRTGTFKRRPGNKMKMR
jgi:archaellum biogenesis protein FlaJ (TadC family)